MLNIKVIYPGTFDPITFGHLDIIKRTAKIFGQLVVAVAEDTEKSPIFNLEERVELVNHDIEYLCHMKKKIEVKSFKGLLMDFALEEKAAAIIRGMRALSDFEYEFQMAYMNHKLSPEIETIFLPASENGHFISSRFVKQLGRLGGNLSGFVSDNVAKKLREHFNNE
jgi:pantetheine-phosphate adenylyltransferase